MQVHESGGDDQAGRIEDDLTIGRTRPSGDTRHATVLDDDIHHFVPVVARVYDPPADDSQARVGHAAASSDIAPRRRYRIAILTATPFVTCASTRLRGPCATRGSIST